MDTQTYLKYRHLLEPNNRYKQPDLPWYGPGGEEGPEWWEELDKEMAEFIIKDSGTRQSFEGGMVRDVADDKIDYSLITDGPMFKRWAIHLTNGAKKYAKRNWMLAQGNEEYSRFKESAFRHFMQWYYDERDEDHASAVFFNLNGAEYIKEKLGKKS